MTELHPTTTPPTALRAHVTASQASNPTTGNADHADMLAGCSVIDVGGWWTGAGARSAFRVGGLVVC